MFGKDDDEEVEDVDERSSECLGESVNRADSQLSSMSDIHLKSGRDMQTSLSWVTRNVMRRAGSQDNGQYQTIRR